MEIFVERRPGGAGEPSEVDAFADLYNRTYSPLVGYCRRYCPPGYDAEDIAQEALAKAWSSWDRYSPARPFWPWVATIARRLCVDYWRRDERAVARAGVHAALEPCPQPRPDELSEAADECRMAVTAFRRLRPDHQRIVGLRDIEGWSYEDIARFEGVTVESIRGSLRRARMSLRKSYDSLAKGTVPALAPIAGLLKAFQSARTRFANRMARWQANLQDAGMASGRLGEALVSLMALSVAAVGVGAPSSDAALRVDNDARGELSVSAARGDGPGTDSKATAGGGAGVGGLDASNGLGSNVKGTFGTTDYDPTNGLNPLKPTDPTTSVIRDFTVSPNYQEDGTVFAVAASCFNQCYTVFRSQDRGATWTDLKTVGLTGPELLLPPAFPDDERIFATGDIGLQVSTDGGRSFAMVLPSDGTAAMSPAFSSGDPRIFMPDAPGIVYDADRSAPRPLDLRPGPSSTAMEYTYGFPTRYDAARPSMYIGANVPGVPARKGVVYRCSGSSCDEGVVLPGLIYAPRIAVVPMADGRDAVLALQGSFYYRSLDDGKTFTRIPMPGGAIGLMRQIVSGSRVYVIAVQGPHDAGEIWFSDDAGASWTNLPDPGGSPDTYITAVQPLPDGRLLAALYGELAGFACSHDGGRTWAPSC